MDNALRVLQLMAERDRVRVSDVAAELDIAPSSAHRLLSTLRLRGFADQGSDRSYAKGPAYQRLVGHRRAVPALEDVVWPHLERLRDLVNETTHMSVLTGPEMRFIASAESDQVLRVGARTGAGVPAHRTSGGKALLAGFSDEELARRFPPDGLRSLLLPEDDLARFRNELRVIRRRGYGVNRGESERGVAAVGVGLPVRHGGPARALSISVPTARFTATGVAGMVAALQVARDALDAELAA